MSSLASTIDPVSPGIHVESITNYLTRKFHPVNLGDTFEGSRYKILRKLGYGSYSTVWLARDTKLGRYVALKIGQAGNPSTEETKIYDTLARTELLMHSGRGHYLPLLDRFWVNGPNGTHLTLVYEPMAPSVYDVRETIFQNGPFPLPMAKSILWQTLLGLDFLLAHGIVHGDVQTRNILFTVDNLTHLPEPELAQFTNLPIMPTQPHVPYADGPLPQVLIPADSLMRYFDISRPFTIKVTDLGASFLTSQPPSRPGPPFYLRAPETIFQNCITAKQDMWSFGCLIFEFITGIMLFDISDVTDMTLIDELQFVDMYNVLGLPPDENFRYLQFPAWRRFFNPRGGPIAHIPRKRARDFNMDGPRICPPLEALLEEALNENFPPGELETTKHLLRGLLEFDPEKRFSTKDVMEHRWFSQQREDVRVHQN